MTIQLYAKTAKQESNGDDLLVTLTKVDVAQLVHEIPPRTILEELTFSDVEEYYLEVAAE